MKTDIVIVTCLRNDMASQCLPAIVADPGINVKGVVLATGGSPRKWRYYWRRLKKILSIGPLGALNGRSIRPWFRVEYPDIELLCRQYNIPFHVVPYLNGEDMTTLLKSLSTTLGVSLGNGYIAPRVFTIPKYGMINVHSEILPAYQNAQSIIWPIYCNDPHSGFTIHEIERKIDGGKILLQKKYDLDFYPTLEETVRKNKERIDKDIPAAVADVCANIESYRENGIVQGKGGHYTTPSYWQFRRMVRNNARFYAEQQNRKDGAK